MLVRVNKILYSTDLSKGSFEAFKYAAFLAKETGAEIHILHVVEGLSSDAKTVLETYVMDAGRRKDIFQDRLQHAREKVQAHQEDFWNTVTEPDQEVRSNVKSVQVIESHPVEAILKASRELEVDLIVMGTHEKGFMETFLGSVAKNVLSRSRVPVLVVPLPERQL